MKGSDDKMGFFYVVLATIASSVYGEICNIYEISNSNGNERIIPSKIPGLYKVDYRKMCDGKPTYKHEKYDSYIFSRESKWMIGSLQNDKSCDFDPFAYKEPTTNRWRYFSKKNRVFIREIPIKQSCVCGVVQLISHNDISSLKQDKILGTYQVNSLQRCYNHTTYKHVENGYQIHVNANNKWVISDGQTTGSTNTCLTNGIAFNPAKLESNVPSKDGWSFLDSSSNRWRIDASMSAICTCKSFMVSASLMTTIAGKNNLSGIYEIYNIKRQCNGRQIYKNTRAELFLYVDTDDAWIIGGPNELATCKNFGYAYSKTNPAPDTPSPHLWTFYNYIRDSWCTDEEMTITCI